MIVRLYQILRSTVLSAAFLLVLCSPVCAGGQLRQEGAAYGPELEGFDYPWPVEKFTFFSQRQTVTMVYLDVPAGHPNGQVAVLLHGKNFCAATWEGTIRFLTAHGYRVIAPDQIGFCKSSKPQTYQFSFGQLARNTRDLLAHLGISRPVMIGHSTGGMLAIRYALMFPQEVGHLVLVDPIGLEDWQEKGVPYRSVDDWYAAERNKTADQIRTYEKQVYYANQWRPEYEKWVQMLAGMYRGPGGELVAWNSALLYDMIFTQPVVHNLQDLKVPTLLMIGDRDITAIGNDTAPPAVQRMLGRYPELGRQAARTIPGAKLLEFRDLGHSPQMQDPAAFHTALLKGLNG
ncbi:alpha/beta fold hydrolase [Komagataeibacter diospyri]|uniref:alpha/beta fold hydrolase n=1 Tax=Komagataeibacter diospyri TaxID=1932662 RepID=UPI003756F83F